MAENNNKNETPRWLENQNAQIERATALIKQFGSSVEFVVAKDRTFLDEVITPLKNIDSAVDFLYRQEGRGINSEDIATFRKDYAELIDLISKVENLAVGLLAKTNVRVDNRNLARKIRDAKRNNTKKPLSKTNKEEKEVKKAS